MLMCPTSMRSTKAILIGSWGSRPLSSVCLDTKMISVVPLPRLNPLCASRRILSARCLLNREVSTFRKIFPARKDWEAPIVAAFRLFTLPLIYCYNVSLQSLGRNCLSLLSYLQTELCKSSKRVASPCLNRSGGRSSGPAALPDFKKLIALTNSVSVMGSFISVAIG